MSDEDERWRWHILTNARMAAGAVLTELGPAGFLDEEEGGDYELYTATTAYRELLERHITKLLEGG